MTGGLAYPLAGAGLITNTVAGAAVGGANTGFNNYVYSEEKSALRNMVIGGFAGFVGSGTDKVVTFGLSGLLPSRMGNSVVDPGRAILIQNIGIPNPYPSYMGWGVAKLLVA